MTAPPSSIREYEIHARSTDVFGRVMCSAREPSLRRRRPDTERLPRRRAHAGRGVSVRRGGVRRRADARHREKSRVFRSRAFAPRSTVSWTAATRRDPTSRRSTACTCASRSAALIPRAPASWSRGSSVAARCMAPSRSRCRREGRLHRRALTRVRTDAARSRTRGDHGARAPRRAVCGSPLRAGGCGAGVEPSAAAARPGCRAVRSLAWHGPPVRGDLPAPRSPEQADLVRRRAARGVRPVQCRRGDRAARGAAGVRVRPAHGGGARGRRRALGDTGHRGGVSVPRRASFAPCRALRRDVAERPCVHTPSRSSDSGTSRRR